MSCSPPSVRSKNTIGFVPVVSAAEAIAREVTRPSDSDIASDE